MPPSTALSNNVHINCDKVKLEEEGTQTEGRTWLEQTLCDSGFDSANDEEFSVKTISLAQVIQSAVYGMFPQGKRNKSTQTFIDPVVARSEILARDTVFYLLNENVRLIGQDHLSVCLRDCVTEMLNRHEILFNAMVKRLDVVPETGTETFFAVADQVFLNNGISWGRIVALYAFAGRLAVYCREMDMPVLLNDIPQLVSKYVAKKLVPFIRKSGGWNGLCEQYPLNEDMNGKVWRCLLVMCASMAIVATLLAIHSS